MSQPTLIPETGEVKVPGRSEYATWTIELEKGQWVRDPTSTKDKRIYGPMRLEWSNHPSGISVTIL